MKQQSQFQPLISGGEAFIKSAKDADKFAWFITEALHWTHKHMMSGKKNEYADGAHYFLLRLLEYVLPAWHEKEDNKAYRMGMAFAEISIVFQHGDYVGELCSVLEALAYYTDKEGIDDIDALGHHFMIIQALFVMGESIKKYQEQSKS